MNATGEARSRYAGALQSALTLNEVSDAFMSVAGEVISAGGLGLYRVDKDGRDVLDVRASVAEDFLGDYEDYGRNDDPVLDFVVRERKPIDSSQVGHDRWRSCGARAALEVGGYCHSMEAPVLVSGALFGTINFARGSAHHSFKPADLAAVRFASEQLGLAAERALRFELTGHRVTMLERTLDQVPEPVVVSDLDGRQLYSNRAARNLSLTTDDQPADGPEHVHDGIAEALEEFRVHGRRVHTTSVPGTPIAERLIVKSFRLPENHDAAVTVVFKAGRQEGKRLPAWNVLSRREQEIAELVAQGWTTKQIAERAFISTHTVRQHVKRMFAKTGVRSRAELVQMVWASGNQTEDSDS
ncbi:LuxR C-terminal-related transcriptional regulator [Amycolatopsis taiwanensis]|uniref:LuxR C-terminal-related transcriptional regulator n=1 Tax=Amycolatopsis taiwanensis TaxID=342230 RepID=UPI000482DF1F|nr:LuxR C-terminal-related transcriptional regulator [Amycolatopsis taiwanensis]